MAQKCSQVCSHLLAPPSSGCGKVFDTPAKCESECYEHVTPQGGNPPEATESELDCGISAPDCDTWHNCGDLT